MDIVKAINITKKFTAHTALEDVSVNIPKGSIYGLLGPNGAGKTTLIRIINHITAPDAGEIIFDNHPLSEADVVNIGYLPEERGLYKKMKVGEQAVFFARLKGLSRQEAIRELRKWFERFEIMDWWDKKVEDLSKGMAQKVQFIVTVLHKPKLLIFDEPFSGFDPINADLLKREILQLREQGATIIFSTHNMESVEELCDNFTLINRSHNILSGNVEEVRKQFGHNRFHLSFAGDPANLSQALQPILESTEILPSIPSGAEQIHNAYFRLKQNVSTRDFISLANENVDIITFDRALPSMNDIFISAVKNYNENNPSMSKNL